MRFFFFSVLSSAHFLAYGTGNKLPTLRPGMVDSENTKNYSSHIIKKWIPLLEQREVMRTLPVYVFPT